MFNYYGCWKKKNIWGRKRKEREYFQHSAEVVTYATTKKEGGKVVVYIYMGETRG